MGQQEIIEYLRQKRVLGDHNYFTTHEIMKGCNGGSAHYSAVKKSLWSLVRHGVIEVKDEGDVFEWVKTFRLANKYVESKQ